MAVDVCQRDFGTIITTGAVNADGYEVENLLGKTDMWGQPKGFVAECFIKPPVDVTFMFPFNLWIKKILIDPKVGGQMSIAVEVFTASVSMPPCQEGNRQSALKGKTRTSNSNQKTNFRSQTQMLSEKETAVFSSIGKAFSVDDETTCFCFVNHSYRPLHPQITSSGPCQEDSKPGVVSRSLRYAQPGALTNVSHVTVRVNRAASGSVAIRSVQIWGQPSVTCSKPSVQWFLQVAKSIENAKCDRKKSGQVPVAGGQQNVACNKTASLERKTLENCKRSVDPPGCPEEFLDPITNEMLVLPLLLPSGHTVDRETLQKHSKAEAVWGRPPNDPFTGIPFSKGRQPLPNVKLKERLDRYLLEGARIVPSARDVGRAGGVASDKTIPTPASLVRTTNQESKSSVDSNSEQLHDTQPEKRQDFQKSSRHFQTSKTSPTTFRIQAAVGTLRPGRGPKRKATDHNLDGELLSKKRSMACDRRWASTQIPNALQSLSSSSSSTSAAAAATATAAAAAAAPTRASANSHEELLAQSLDTALESTLSSLPSFSKPPVQPSSCLAGTTPKAVEMVCKHFVPQMVMLIVPQNTSKQGGLPCQWAAEHVHIAV